MNEQNKPIQAVLSVSTLAIRFKLLNGMWLKNKVKQTKRLLKAGGPCFVAKLLVQKLLAPVVRFGSVIFFAGGIAYEPQQTSTGKTSAGVNILYASREDYPALIRGRTPAISYEKYTRRLDSGDRCVIAVTPLGEIVHSRWITTNPRHIPEIGMALVPGPKDLYFYDGYTWPDYRGRDIDGEVRSFIFQQLRERGLDRAVSYVAGNNLVGLKAARRKQKCIGRLVYFCFGNMKPVVIWKSNLDGVRLVEAAGNDE